MTLRSVRGALGTLGLYLWHILKDKTQSNNLHTEDDLKKQYQSESQESSVSPVALQCEMNVSARNDECMQGTGKNVQYLL